jgi:SanA protein
MKRLLITLLILGLIAISAVVVINLEVRSYSTDRIYNDIGSLPSEERIAIVLGARVRNGVPSDMLYDRVLTGVELYKAGKIQNLLFSGGGDEPFVMKKIAVELGVPETDMILDDLGQRTYESCVRAKQTFQIEKAIIVTQGFHLARSIYLCQSIGLDTIGLNADRREYDAEGFGGNREYFANLRAWYDINFGF